MPTPGTPYAAGSGKPPRRVPPIDRIAPRGPVPLPVTYPTLAMTTEAINAEIKAAPDADLGDLAADLLTAIAEGASGKLRLALLLCARIIRAVL